MSDQVHMTVQCHVIEDGTGDLMVEIPSEALDAIGVAIGDLLSVEIINGEIVLKPTREAGLS